MHSFEVLPPKCFLQVHIHPNGSLYYQNEGLCLTSNYDLRNFSRSFNWATELAYNPTDLHEKQWEVYIGSRGVIWIDHDSHSASIPNQELAKFQNEIEQGNIVSSTFHHSRLYLVR